MTGAIWADLSPEFQDGAYLAGLLLPLALCGFLVLRGYAPGPVLLGLLRQNLGVSLIFVGLIAAAIAVGTGLIAQERGIRNGSANAADRFDLIVAAPGSEVTATLATVYLRPADMPLLDGESFAEIANAPAVSLASPIAFGDSHAGSPVIGTTAGMVTHLSGGLSQGRMFAALEEAVIGAKVPLEIGDIFEPAHGQIGGAVEDAHGDLHYVVTGRMNPTQGPWDTALLVPIESTWEVHGMAGGHGPEWDGTLGPPFEPAYFPGTPAVFVRAEHIAANYALRARFTTDRTMAFFPGTVLNDLHGLIGNVRHAMSVLALLTQVLVGVSVLAALMILTRLLARRFALLLALGAPRRFVCAITWSFAVSLIMLGTLLGLVLGLLTTRLISAQITARTDVLVQASLGWPEVHLVAGFVSCCSLLALLPAITALRRPAIGDLRG